MSVAGRRNALSNNPELTKAEKQVAAAEATVTSAHAIVTDLEAKRGDAIRRGTELADERSSIAFQAHTGDEKAARCLKEVHQEISEHSSELASLDAAVRAASTKVEAAKAALAVELQKVDTLKLRAASRTFAAHMRKLDKALDELVNVLYDVEPIRQQLDALGVGPSFDQFRILGERPMLLALEDTIFEGRIGRRLAPSERTTFTQLAEAWTKSHEATVQRILGEQQADEAAA
jgi:uncharacterized protein YukE